MQQGAWDACKRGFEDACLVYVPDARGRVIPFYGGRLSGTLRSRMIDKGTDAGMGVSAPRPGGC